MFLVRLDTFLARLQSLVDSEAEQTVSDRKPCRNPLCGNTISDNMVSGFCFTCSTELAHQEKELADELPIFLRLEAEFVAWCIAHGHPDPHA